jgi:hypothetical protein
MKPIVIQCVCCGRVKRFGEFILPPKHLITKIFFEEVTLSLDTCQDCWDDVCPIPKDTVILSL